VPAGGARLFVIRLPARHGLALGVNGTPLLQMSLYGADGTPLEASGPLRVVSLPSARASSPVQLIVSNEGVAPAPISLSLRADPPPPPAVAPPADPSLPDPGAGPAAPAGEAAGYSPSAPAAVEAPPAPEGAPTSERP